MNFAKIKQETKWEEFKEVPGWEGFYGITRSGEVISLPRTILRIKNGTTIKVIWSGKVMSLSKMTNGYLFCSLRKNGDSKVNASVHRMVAMAFIPNPHNKPCVNHKNGVKWDNRVENLEWVNKSENSIHAIKNNIVKSFAETHCFAKLKNKDIPIIRSLKISRAKIGRMYGVSATAIQHILEGKSWKSIA